jgi:hypothetical protein
MVFLSSIRVAEAWNVGGIAAMLILVVLLAALIIWLIRRS